MYSIETRESRTSSSGGGVGRSSDQQHIELLRQMVRTSEEALAKERSQTQKSTSRKSDDYRVFNEQVDALKTSERHLKSKVTNLTNEIALVRRKSMNSPIDSLRELHPCLLQCCASTKISVERTFSSTERVIPIDRRSQGRYVRLDILLVRIMVDPNSDEEMNPYRLKMIYQLNSTEKNRNQQDDREINNKGYPSEMNFTTRKEDPFFICNSTNLRQSTQRRSSSSSKFFPRAFFVFLCVSVLKDSISIRNKNITKTIHRDLSDKSLSIC